MDGMSMSFSRDVSEIRWAFNQIRYRAGLPGLTDDELNNPKTIQKLIEQEDHNNTYHFTGEKDELIKAIENELSSGDLILFKSSNGTDLLTVVDFFKKEEKL